MSTKAKQLRVQLGLTQMDVAMKTGVHPSLISRLENGDGGPGERPGLEGLKALADFYGCTIDTLISVAPDTEAETLPGGDTTRRRR